MSENASTREFPFHKEHFEFVRRELYDYAGIALANYKMDMVYGRLVRRLRALQLDSFDLYFDHLKNDPQEFGQFVNAMTTNLTSFFREKHHFDFVRDTFLPEMKKRSERRVRIWSAGCSLGEETYSIAITLLEAGLNPMQWDCKILATDIDSQVLESAESGVYLTDRVSALQKNLVHKWFYKGQGGSNGKVRVKPELQRLIHFKQLNLMDGWPMRGPFDLIFCRNVMIYFDGPTKARIQERMLDLLRSGGYLILGHSESIACNRPDLLSVGRTIYQKR